MARLAAPPDERRPEQPVAPYRAAFELAPVGMALGDDRLVVTEVNDALCEFLGHGRHELCGHRLLELLHPDDRGAEAVRLRAAITAGQPTYRRRTRHLRPDGVTVWGDLTLAVQQDPDGRPRAFVAHLVDATDAERREVELRQHSLQDPLTHLLNRRALFEAYDDLRPRPGDDRGAMLAVLFCDLDRFKEVNDQAGHLVGDELLRLVARRLQHSVRPEDRLARLGGDEFVVLCRVEEPADAVAFARRVVRCFDEPFSVGDRRLRLGVSVGVSVAGAGAAADRQLAAADAAMYLAKRGGRPIALAGSGPAGTVDLTVPDCGDASAGRAVGDRNGTRTGTGGRHDDGPAAHDDEDPTMAPTTPPPGHDTATGTDPDATYDEPGYQGKSLGQAVNADAELVDELVEESGGDLDEAERRFAEESAGAPTLARQGGGEGGGAAADVAEADRANGEPGAQDA